MTVITALCGISCKGGFDDEYAHSCLRPGDRAADDGIDEPGRRLDEAEVVGKAGTAANQPAAEVLRGTECSAGKCGQGQGPHGFKDVFLLPVASYGAGDQDIHCRTRARSVLVDLGGYPITEDNRFPESSWELDGQPVPFTRDNLEPICDDLIAKGYLGDPRPATLDVTRPLTGQALNSGVFTAR